MTRRSITHAARARIFLAASGLCHICGLQIYAIKQRWDVEHVKPLWLGGTDDESNMRPAHINCHASKSADEAPQRAKSNRIRARRIGIRKPRSIRQWRRFDGSIGTAPRERNRAD